MTGFWDKTTPLTGADVRGVQFPRPPFGARGYAMTDVDAFLDRVEDECRRRFG